MPAAKVSLAECCDYDEGRVYAAVRESLEPLGGIGEFVALGQQVLLLANLVGPRPPESAVCTHPSVVKAVCRLVREAGGNPAVGGSSAGSAYGRTQHSIEVSGIGQAVAELGVEALDYDRTGGRDVPSCGGLMESYHVALPVLEADVLITLPKMKTHGLTLFTGAVKNHLGVVPGARKAELHRRFPASERFGQALVDLYCTVPPQLAIMDAIEGMDGDGPAAGRKRQVGLIAASDDGAALDATMCAIAGLDERWVATLAPGRRLDRGDANLDQIQILGPFGGAKERLRPFAYPLTMRLMAHGWIPAWGREKVVKHVGGAPVSVYKFICRFPYDLICRCPVRADM